MKTLLEFVQNNSKKIQGLESYSFNELKDIVERYIDDVLEDNDLTNEVEIVDIGFHGSRCRNQGKNNSDLDCVIQYNGDIREDDFFNILNDNDDPLYIGY